ncbi:hypothetical protein EJ04DRAFT_455774 [Polyplosphaeria fusca]|uniref:DUF7730 domain-containing protein n=1 Tax=Polyplosphaeria fusca TaxID=682080 RepID=A0A9P4V8P6_9PLEO|nr:hypothetical protein EJ04DRAFT_455774 [Polyplosphaeria fusca]
MSLFSRARPGMPAPKKRIRGFLGLPGELRNKIYDYYFEEDLRVEFAAKGTELIQARPPNNIVKLRLNLVDQGGARRNSPVAKVEKGPKTLRMSRCLGRYQRVHSLATLWESSLCALIYVCKQIYSEALSFLYRHANFVFAAPKRIKNYMDIVPQQNLVCMTKLELHYNTYGSPLLEQHRVWPEKHRESWMSASKQATKKLVNLKQLKLWIHVHERSVLLDLRQPWLQPILQFRRLNCPFQKASASPQTNVRQPLEVVNVRFKTFWSGPHRFSTNFRLAKASVDLHQLFAQAISLFIIGKSEDTAMAGFKEAWEGKYSEWRHHLNYSATGW